MTDQEFKARMNAHAAEAVKHGVQIRADMRKKAWKGAGIVAMLSALAIASAMTGQLVCAVVCAIMIPSTISAAVSFYAYGEHRWERWMKLRQETLDDRDRILGICQRASEDEEDDL